MSFGTLRIAKPLASITAMTLKFTVPIEIRKKTLDLELKKRLLFKPYIFFIWWAIIIIIVVSKGPANYYHTHDGITETKDVNFFVETFGYIGFASLLIILRRKVFKSKTLKNITNSPVYMEERQITINDDNYEITGNTFNLKQPIKTIIKITKKDDFHYIETSNKTPFVIPNNTEGLNQFIEKICEENKINVC